MLLYIVSMYLQVIQINIIIIIIIIMIIIIIIIIILLMHHMYFHPEPALTALKCFKGGRMSRSDKVSL